MSGTISKLFSIFLFTALVAGVCFVPGSDCTYDNMSTAENPYTSIHCDAAVFWNISEGETIYLLSGSAVYIYPYVVSGVEEFSVLSVTDGAGLTLTDFDAGALAVESHILSGTVGDEGIIYIVLEYFDHSSATMNQLTVPLEIVLPSSGEGGEGGSGDQGSQNGLSGEAEGNEIDHTQVINVVPLPEGLSSDSRDYTPWLALFIVLAIVIVILYCVRKVVKK